MYGPYLVTEGKSVVIYVELLKALYGTMQAARLFWEKLSKQLIEWGYVINPYDRCVANKMINGNPCTVVWHVDDLKISQKDTQVVDAFIQQLEKTFGKETPLSKSRGKVHDYLGMILDYRNAGEVSINMIPYVKMVLASVPEDMQGKAVTPAANYLYKVNESNPTYLDTDTTEMFHLLTMQLQYLAQRGCPDILQAVSFLSSRVQQPEYLQSTKDLVLRLSTDTQGTIYWWVDVSYAVHPNMHGHTGGTMSMGRGSVYSTSTKQKLVTRSSTECELVGIHDVMPQIEWTKLFLEAQGYAMQDTVLYQDNMSAILLEKNGRASSSKRTKHIHQRYFYVKEKVDNGDIRVEHCPTEQMMADFFTKPLRGSLFRKLRDHNMNIDANSKYHSNHRSVLNPEIELAEKLTHEEKQMAEKLTHEEKQMAEGQSQEKLARP
jgi:hypothetical protein